MTTVRTIIERAYRKIRVTGQGVSLTAENASEGVDALNAMLARYDGDIYTHAALDLNDTFPLDANLEEAAQHVLAGELAVDKGRQIDALLGSKILNGRRRLQASLLTVPTATFPTNLSRLSSRYWGSGLIS